MKKKLKNTLYEYTLNSRITTKELGKKTNSSQQSASYLLKTLKSKKIIQNEATMVDAVKLGYINTLIGFNYTKLDNQTQKEVINELKRTKDIVGIEESKEGFDLLIEFSTQNLAALNKIHTELIYKLENKIKTMFIFPIITRYVYPRKYLKTVRTPKAKILFGNRNPPKMTQNDTLVLKELVREPTQKIIDISEKTKINMKTVTKTKKNLEKKFIIKGYTATLDNKKLGINREIIFLRFSGEGLRELNKFLDFSRGHKNIIETIKVIGSSQIIITVESLNEIEIIKELRSLFRIENYMIFRSSEIYKKTFLPEQ
jgi:DNA-binding Lrp family transcriptional regulator